MTSGTQIEIWLDTTSDPDAPKWCVSLCDSDGDECECLRAVDDRDDAISSARREALARQLPLYERDDHGCISPVEGFPPQPDPDPLITVIEDGSQTIIYREPLSRIGVDRCIAPELRSLIARAVASDDGASEGADRDGCTIRVTAEGPR